MQAQSQITARARALAEYILSVDALYKGGLLETKSRDDFIDRYIVRVLEVLMKEVTNAD